MKCVNIKLWDILSCFHYILNAPRTLHHISTMWSGFTHRGVPAFTQSTQLRTLIFECPKKIKTSQITKNTIKTCLTRVRSLNTEKNLEFVGENYMNLRLVFAHLPINRSI